MCNHRALLTLESVLNQYQPVQQLPPPLLSLCNIADLNHQLLHTDAQRLRVLSVLRTRLCPLGASPPFSRAWGSFLLCPAILLHMSVSFAIKALDASCIFKPAILCYMSIPPTVHAFLVRPFPPESLLLYWVVLSGSC